MTPKEVLSQIRQREVATVDLRFMDFPGVWQHFAIPAEGLTEETFEDGISFDGSSVVGWRAINEADLLVVPQPETALIDPFAARPTLTMICNMQDPITQQDYTRDPRNIARKAASYMKSTGLADSCRVAPELEFFVFDSVRYDQKGTRRSTTSTRPRGRGTRARVGVTSGRRPLRAWATSHARRSTASRTSAPRWPRPSTSAESRPRPITTKSLLEASARLTWPTATSSTPPTA